jgi:hypothetical protein
MPDFLEQFGKSLESWSGQPMGNRMTHFYIYERDGSYTAVGLIGGSYISQPFDHHPSAYEVEEHFKEDERFKEHFR